MVASVPKRVFPFESPLTARTGPYKNLEGASILLLTTYRPGYQPAWLGKSYATQISLHSLIPHDALHVVHSTSHHVELSYDYLWCTGDLS
jgi:hypothetical protein